MVEGGHGGAKEGGAAGDEEGEVGEAREGRDEGRVRVGGVGDVEGNLGVPEGLGDGRHACSRGSFGEIFDEIFSAEDDGDENGE